MQNGWLRGALSAVLISGLLASAVGATLEAPPQEPATGPQGPPRGPGGSPEQRADELARQLRLTDQQRGEVVTIFKNQHQQLEALRNASAGDRTTGREQLRKLDAETDARLKVVLTAPQYNQYLAQKPKRGQGPKEGKGGRPPQAPPQAD